MDEQIWQRGKWKKEGLNKGKDKIYSRTCNIVMVTMTSARNLRALPLTESFFNSFHLFNNPVSLLLFQVIWGTLLRGLENINYYGFSLICIFTILDYMESPSIKLKTKSPHPFHVFLLPCWHPCKNHSAVKWKKLNKHI